MNETMIERFLAHQRLELNRSPLTVSSYGSDLRQFSSFIAGGNRQVDYGSVTTGDIRTWLAHVAAQGGSVATLRRKVQSLRTFYRYMMRRGLVAANPAADVQLARKSKRLPHLLQRKQLDRLLAAPVDETDFEQVRDHLMVVMLYATGLRRAELIGLQDAAVDVGAGQIRVHGKRDKDRIVPIGPELAACIGRYRNLRNSHVGRHVEAFFVRPQGKPLYPTLVYRVVHNALQHLGGEQSSPHVLRHTFASALLNDGAELASVKELLGHESLAATQVYTHVTLSELKSNYKHAHPRAIKKGG